MLADVTIPNANVYYEVGVRHGRSVDPDRCLMVAAEWAQPVFDLAQLRSYRFPLPPGPLTAEVAAEARKRIEAWLNDAALGTSPVRTVVTGGDPGRARVVAFAAQTRALSETLDRMRTIRLRPRDEQAEAARALRDELLAEPAVVPAIRLELLQLIRDCLGWAEVIAYVDSALTDAHRALPWVREQSRLAQG